MSHVTPEQLAQAQTDLEWGIVTIEDDLERFMKIFRGRTDMTREQRIAFLIVTLSERTEPQRVFNMAAIAINKLLEAGK